MKAGVPRSSGYLRLCLIQGVSAQYLSADIYLLQVIVLTSRAHLEGHEIPPWKQGTYWK